MHVKTIHKIKQHVVDLFEDCFIYEKIQWIYCLSEYM